MYVGYPYGLIARRQQTLMATWVPKPQDKPEERLMFTISVSFWSLNLNQKLLWLLPPFLLFNVCKHQYIKKNPERTRFGEKIKWPRIYICSLNTNIRYHQIQNIGIILEDSIDLKLLKNAFYELISYDCKSTEKIHFFVLSLCGHIVNHTNIFGALTHGSRG